MLRITQQSSTAAAQQYYTSADYYAEGQEIVGRWGGKGAALLGLHGRISRREFNRLCENRHPHSDEALTARRKDERTVGYDFTWSVPKSVSLLYALAEDPAVKEELLSAFRQSVAQTMQEIEAEMKTRVRRAGRNEERLTGNMLWAEFVHFTARPVDGIPDPQLHAHCFVFNATHDAQEGTWKAGQFRDLKRDAPYWQAAMRVRLANRLQKLGYTLQCKKGDFEIAGVAASTIRVFSRRQGVVEAAALLEEENLRKEYDNPDLRLSASSKAALGGITREGKNYHLSPDELLKVWQDRLGSAGQQALQEVQAQRGRHVIPPQRDAEAVRFAGRHLLAGESVVAEKRLLAEALRYGLGTVSVEGVTQACRNSDLLVQQHAGRRLYTSKEVLAEEDRLLSFARQGRGTRRPLGQPDHPIVRTWLNVDQRRAVQHVLSSRDRVILLRGAAGTGKTTLMQEAVQAIAEGGHQVTVLAPSATASRDVLRKEGFAEADTVARFLLSPEMHQKASDQVIWIDEAGLLGSQDMAAVFGVAERVNARVILMGDRRQHGSPARGSPLKLLEEQAGVPSVAVTDIVRQRGSYREAVGLLSQGATAEALEELDRLGWIREVSGDERYMHLAQTYLEAVAEKKSNGTARSVLIVSPTHAEADRITGVIRDRLTAQGKLTAEREYTTWVPQHLSEAERGEASSYSHGELIQFHQNGKGYRNGQRLVVDGATPLPLDQANRFQVYRPKTLKLAAGDRLRITAGGKTADGRHRLNNGALFTIEKITPEGHLVVDNGWIISKDFGHIAHGYVVTSHAGQGKTADLVLIGQSSQSLPASGREQFYVSVSRGREQALIFTDDRQALLQAVDRDRQRPNASEVFGQAKSLQRFRLHTRMNFLRRLAARNLESPSLQHDREQVSREVQHER